MEGGAPAVQAAEAVLATEAVLAAMAPAILAV